MRVLSLVCTLALGVALSSAQSDRLAGPQFKFDKTVHDFGTINPGDVVNTTFQFQNEGDSPLIITNVDVTCGCTTPKYPKQPIAPGKSADIEVGFNSKGKSGNFYKAITIHSNAPDSPTRIFIKGTISK